MTNKKIDSSFIPANRMHVGLKFCFVILVYLFTILPTSSSFGQDYPEYDEIALFLDVPNLGGRNMDVLIKDNEVYLPITDLFDFLMIKNTPTQGLDTISGFFISQDAPYLIDRPNLQIQYRGELFKLNPGDLIRTETNLYLRGMDFGKIFGLECEFNFRTLSVRINTRLELPAIREMRLEAMRKNINRLVGKEEADTTIGRSYPWFHFGMADWSANLSEQLDGKVDSRLGLSLGSIIAGGEAIVGLNYNSYAPFTEKQQYYLWRYVNNENKALRQVMAGKISTGATSSIYNPVVGAKITNTSTQFRRSFGTYTLSDRTKPNWIVELYVNNVLVDYTTADASGFFTFEVPLVYGNTNVMLKFYGPYGEERTQEQNITIPFNFIPEKTLEYSVSAGMVEDNNHSKYSRSNVYYGLSRSITIGSGVEYLSSVSSGPVMPFVNGSFRLASNLLLSGEFSPNVRSKGTLTYRLPSSLQFDINYIYYTKGQKAIYNNFREERKFSMSMPVRFRNFSLYNRFTINQLVLPSSNYTTSEWLISGALFGISTNITSYGVFVGNTKPYFYSDFSLSFQLPKDISIQPRAQYSYTNNEFLSAKLLVEKRVLKKGYLTASYEQNYRSNMHLVEFGFRYNLKFAQTSIMARQTDESTRFIQYARGSIIDDSKTNYVYTDDRGNVGKGGICIIPFIDNNGNGTREPGEPKVYGLNLRANSGRIEKREIDTAIRIFGLEPYTDCFIEFDQSSLDNIAWRLKYRSMNIAVDPNMIKLVEIPINVVGEAAGMVRIASNDALRGLGRIIVNIYDKDQKKVGSTLSEQDGFFSYFGLNPGNYEAGIDTAQLRKLRMVSSPGSISFNIAANIDGDYVDGLDFVIKIDTVRRLKAPETMKMIVHEETEQGLISTRDRYAIETRAFENKAEAESVREQLSTLPGKDVTLISVDGQYKVRITGFETKNEVRETYPELQTKGIGEISLITMHGTIEPRLLTIITGAETDTVKSIAENDTAVLVVHKMIQKDTTSTTDRYTIETRAFENKAEAESVREQLSTLPGKDVTLVPVDGQYKVRITGFETKNEVRETYPELQTKGIGEISLITMHGTIEPRLLTIITGAETDTVKSIAKNDTAVLVVHKMIQKDTTSTTDRYTIETRAFENKAEAESVREQLSTLPGKDVTLISVDGQYKVRITGFETKNEVRETYPELQTKGIGEISLIMKQGMAIPALADRTPVIETTEDRMNSQKDSTIVVIHKIIEEDSTSSEDHYAIQLGAFKRKENASRLREKLTRILRKEVVITKENEFSKVRIIGFNSIYEVERYIPTLVKQGEREIWVVTLKGTRKPDLVAGEPDIHREVLNTFTEKDTTYYIIHDVFEEVLTTGPDSYMIQLGSFNRKINADAFRAKLATMLGKKVEIFVEDHLYKVRIIGFKTREDAEAYLPVLHKEDVSEISILMLKGRQNYRTAISRLDTISGAKEKLIALDTSHLTIPETTQEVKISKPDSTIVVNETIEPEKKKDELPTIPSKENVTVKTGILETAPEGDNVEAQSLVERKKSLEQRLLDAEYRSGLYEERWPGVEFTIQIAASKSIKDPNVIKSKFDLSSDVEVTKSDEWYRFSVGHYIKYWRAREYRNILITTKGLNDAFIVAYKDGKKIMLNDLLAMVETLPESDKETNAIPAIKKGFSIQVLATKDGNVSNSDIRNKCDIDDDVYKEYNESDGLYRYTIGNFITYAGAAKVRNKIRANGIRDAFIVGYKDGKRIKDLNLILEGKK